MSLLVSLGSSDIFGLVNLEQDDLKDYLYVTVSALISICLYCVL